MTITYIEYLVDLGGDITAVLVMTVIFYLFASGKLVSKKTMDEFWRQIEKFFNGKKHD